MMLLRFSKIPIANEIQRDIEQNLRGIDNFDNYKKYVGYSVEGLQRLRNTDLEAPEKPYGGDPAKEGIILCQKYGFNILSESFIKEKTEENFSLQFYKENRDEKKALEDAQVNVSYNKLYRKRLLSILILLIISPERTFFLWASLILKFVL